MIAKIKIIVTILIIAFILSLPAKAFLELNQELTFTVNSPGFFPFSPTSNPEVVSQTQAGNSIDFIFTNLSGSPFTVAGGADSRELGKTETITPNPDKPTIFNYNVNFNSAPSGSKTFGISIVPLGTSSMFTVKPEVSQFILPLIPVGDATTEEGEEVVTVPGGSETTGGTEGPIFTPLEPAIPGLPNSITLSYVLIDDLNIGELFSNNTECQSSISQTNEKVTDSNLSTAISNLLDNADSSNTFTFTAGEKINEKIARNLTNETDKTQVYLFGFFPSIAQSSASTPCPTVEKCDNLCRNVGACCGKDKGGNTTHTCQTFSIRCNCQKVLNKSVQSLQASPQVSYEIKTTIPISRLRSDGTGFFETKNKACVRPYCVVVDGGKGVRFPDGACTVKMLSKKRAAFDEINLLNLKNEITQDDIDNGRLISVLDVVTGKTISTTIPRGRAYLVFQPVPPKTTIISQFEVEEGLAEPLNEEPCDILYECPLCGQDQDDSITDDDVANTPCEKCPSFGKCCVRGPDGEVLARCGKKRIGNRECPCRYDQESVHSVGSIQFGTSTETSSEPKLPCPEVTECDRLCSNIGACCENDKNGNATHTCQKSEGGSRCKCIKGVKFASVGSSTSFSSQIPKIKCEEISSCDPCVINACCKRDDRGNITHTCHADLDAIASGIKVPCTCEENIQQRDVDIGEITGTIVYPGNLNSVLPVIVSSIPSPCNQEISCGNQETCDDLEGKCCKKNSNNTIGGLCFQNLTSDSGLKCKCVDVVYEPIDRNAIGEDSSDTSGGGLTSTECVDPTFLYGIGVNPDPIKLDKTLTTWPFLNAKTSMLPACVGFCEVRINGKTPKDGSYIGGVGTGASCQGVTIDPVNFPVVGIDTDKDGLIEIVWYYYPFGCTTSNCAYSEKAIVKLAL